MPPIKLLATATAFWTSLSVVLLAQGEIKPVSLTGYSELSMFALYCATMSAIGVFLRWYIPKIHEDHEKARREERADFLTALATLSATFEKRMEQADRTNERVMGKLELMQTRLDAVEHRFTESGVFSNNNLPPSPHPPARRKAGE